MKIIFDTNIVLDALLKRTPFYSPAVELLTYVENGILSGYLCATTVTTIHYLCQKVAGKQLVYKQIKSLLALFEVAPVTRLVLENALSSKIKDFEDAVIAESAKHLGIHTLVTRNGMDFKESGLTVYSPHELLHTLNLH